MKIHIDDLLLVEIKKGDRWLGFTQQEQISSELREEALQHLSGTPMRYYYPEYLDGRCRVSFLEP